MDELIKRFKSHVILSSSNPKFVHHDWYVKYHLTIVEEIASELCDIYTDANREIVELVVWLHDYGKVMGFGKDHQKTQEIGGDKLLEIGFPRDFTEEALRITKIVDEQENLDLPETPIEAKIISSADGASHMVGPFFPIWFKDNPNHELEELNKENMTKLEKDWKRKIVLPEVKKLFKNRYQFLRENYGDIPKRFLD